MRDVVHLCVAFVILGGRAAAQEIRYIPDDPTCSECSITLTPVVRLGATEGPGMIDWRGGQSFPVIDSQGRIYLRGYFTTEVKVYGADGAYLTTIGREGEGPGEFMGAHGLVIGPHDSLFVFDRRTMRMSVFSPDHAFIRSSRLEVPPPGLGPIIVPWDPDHFYMTAHIRTPELIGWPIHRLDKEGSRLHSFGTRTGEFSPEQPYSGMRIIADAGDGALWSGRVAHYWIERISPDSRMPLEEIRRESEWFPVPDPDDLRAGHDGTEKPPPALTDIYQDGDRLWVLTWATDPKWRDATGVQLEDQYRRYDSVIEVVDLTEGRVIARSRFDELYHNLLGQGLVGGTMFHGGYVPVYQITHMEIDGG